MAIMHGEEVEFAELLSEERLDATGEIQGGLCRTDVIVGYRAMRRGAVGNDFAEIRRDYYGG